MIFHKKLVYLISVGRKINRIDYITFVVCKMIGSFTMAIFKYTVMSALGKEQKGTIEAESEQAAVTALKAKKLFPTVIKKVEGKKKEADSDKAIVGKKKKGILDINIGTPKIATKD